MQHSLQILEDDIKELTALDDEQAKTIDLLLKSSLAEKASQLASKVRTDMEALRGVVADLTAADDTDARPLSIQ